MTLVAGQVLGNERGIDTPADSGLIMGFHP
jgi:hypothetical protein